MLERNQWFQPLSLARKFWSRVSFTPRSRDVNCKHKRLHSVLLRQRISPLVCKQRRH